MVAGSVYYGTPAEELKRFNIVKAITYSSSVKAILDLFKAYESVEILIGIFCLNKTKYNANRGAT